MDEWGGSVEEDRVDQAGWPSACPVDARDRATRGTIDRAAEDPVAAAGLARVASLLRAFPHPGLVELVDAAPGYLSVRRVLGPDLAHARPFDSDEVAAFGAALAATLADLHDLGVTHQALAPEHVLVDPAGRPVLCGLGQAQRRSLDDPAHREAATADTVALAALLQRLGPSTSGALARTLARAEAKQGRAVSCRGLAAQLARATSHPTLPADPWLYDSEGSAAKPRAKTVALRAHAGLLVATGGVAGADQGVVEPGEKPTSPDAAVDACRRPLLSGRGGWRCAGADGQTARGGRKRWLEVGAAVAVAVAVSCWLVASHRTGSGPTLVRAADHSPTPCPTADRGCVPLRHPGGDIDVGGQRFSLGQPDDVVVIGRWDCRVPATPALLRPSDGDIWVFRRWAGLGKPVRGQLLARVRGASSLRVRPGAAGCDALLVIRADAHSLLVSTRPAA